MSENFSFCLLCGQDLIDNENVTRWIHDIINHRGYFEAQVGRKRKDDPVIAMLYDIIEYHQGKYKWKE